MRESTKMKLTIFVTIVATVTAFSVSPQPFDLSKVSTKLAAIVSTIFSFLPHFFLISFSPLYRSLFIVFYRLHRQELLLSQLFLVLLSHLRLRGIKLLGVKFSKLTVPHVMLGDRMLSCQIKTLRRRR